ncbi:IclR family transcriptional regulator [Nakamurella sp. A5-74]|uniref:IclR family transcriptional regulator n=1 Tax=Nakamurella sp. A5-74 TaxID=3158264 RepID=A0AAU8DRR8_9ACTN
MTQASGYRERNSTADRALTILQMFDDQRLVLSAAAVAEHLKVARSTAYRYLQTLVQAQFLTEDGRGGFRLGMKVLQLARLARRSYGLGDVAVPVMRQLTERFHQTVLLTRQMGQAVVCLEREESREQYVRLSYERGTILDLNAGASALVLLAWLSEPQQRVALQGAPLRRFTPQSIVELEPLLERLRAIRADGYAVSYGEVDAEAVGIAVPIFRSSGEVLAAISVVLIRSRVSAEQIDEIRHALLEAAAHLSHEAQLLES